MDTRERLLESTASLLWERGYDATSPRDIQTRSGVGQGSMYHHFAGKTDLAVCALERTADRMIQDASALLDAPGLPSARLRAYLLRERDVLRGCPIGRMAQDASLLEISALREPVGQTLSWLVTRIARLISEAQDCSELSPSLNANDVASAVVATLQGGYVLSRAMGSREPFERSIAGVLALLQIAGLPQDRAIEDPPKQKRS